MNIGDKTKVTIEGIVVKKELYRDGKTRICVQNADTDEVAVVIEKKVSNEGFQSS